MARYYQVVTKTTLSLLQNFEKMSGDSKIRIAFQMSQTVRKVRETGALATKTKLCPWKSDNKISLSR